VTALDRLGPRDQARVIRELGEADQLDGDERRAALNALAEALNLPAPPPGWRPE
jgi:hypothetical protein